MESAPYLPASDIPRFIREMLEFVGFADADTEAIRESAPLVLPHVDELTAALYDHFLKFPRSARFFLQDDGSVDTVRLERRKHSLGRFFRDTAELALTPEFSYSLLTIGLSHSHRPRGPGGTVPPHLMIGAMSLVESALPGIFAADLPADRAVAASVAWNKLLMVQLSVLLLGYLPTRPVA
jgi:hypothetical protein